MRCKDSDGKPRILPDFATLLESGDWDRVSQELEIIFDEVSYEHIDAIEFENGSMGGWIEVLFRTGLLTKHVYFQKD